MTIGLFFKNRRLFCAKILIILIIYVKFSIKALYVEQESSEKQALYRIFLKS